MCLQEKNKPVHSSEVNKAKFKQKALWHVSHTNHHICNGDLLLFFFVCFFLFFFKYTFIKKNKNLSTHITVTLGSERLVPSVYINL